MILSGGALSESVVSGDGISSCIPASVARYLALITAEHADKPDFVATVGLLVQGLADLVNCTLAEMPGKFDLDVAVGDQLDGTGARIGLSRYVHVPTATDFFSLDVLGLGFDEGTWYWRFNIPSDTVALGDEQYRRLLRAKVAANATDGSVPGAYAAWNALFAGTGYQVYVQDLGHMRMALALGAASLPVDDVTLTLLTGPYLGLRPEGVLVEGYTIPTVAAAPFFGLDLENAFVSGFDVGAWGEPLSARWTLFNPPVEILHLP